MVPYIRFIFYVGVIIGCHHAAIILEIKNISLGGLNYYICHIDAKTYFIFH
jgi:hypothetical protein